MPRTITGLDVQEDFSCEVLDLAQKITIMGETPSSKKFLAYKPDNDTTVYQDIDVADDIDINSLSSLTTPDLTAPAAAAAASCVRACIACMNRHVSFCTCCLQKIF